MPFMKGHQKPRFIFWGLLSLVFLLAGPQGRAGAAESAKLEYLVLNGTSSYVIVLPSDAIPAETTAAEELRDHLEQISGAKLPIVAEGDYDGSPMIAVGFNAKLPVALRAASFGPLGDEELLIQAAEGQLLLAGGRPRGALYAVYEYLHRLGVRWYTPKDTVIPKTRTIPLPDESYRYAPPVIVRQMVMGNKADMAWLARNRQSSKTIWTPLGPAYGGTYAEGPDMHTFSRLIKKPTLIQHPDWLSEINGKRELPVGSTWGLCLSNTDVRRYIIARTLDWARKNPLKTAIWVGQNDGSQYCTCKECQAFYDAHGGVPSSLVVQLLNELCDALAEERPDAVVKTLAYGWSIAPPEGMELRESAVIMFCAAGRSYSLPIEADPACAPLRDAMAKWRTIAKHIDVYLYTPTNDYWSPSPHTYALARNITWCSEHGAERLYAQVSGWSDWYGSESVHLRSWAYARLMWNPDLDMQDLIDDFVYGYYGPAAEAVAEAIRLVHTDVLDEDGEPRKHHDNALVPGYVKPQSMRAINKLFEKTYAALDDEVYRNRLSFAWIPSLWADFWLGYSGYGRYDPSTQTWSVLLRDGEVQHRYGVMAKQFMMDHGVQALKEARSLNPTKLAVDKIGVPWPAHLLKDGSVEAVVVPGVGGEIFEFKDKALSFAPLKPMWAGLKLEYPMFSTTSETVNGAQVEEYAVAEAGANQVVLSAATETCAIRKTVSLSEGTLNQAFTVTATKKGTIAAHTCVMFDLMEGVFDFQPTVYVEKKNGEWTERVMGVETDFWWIEENLDIQNATGRVVLKREKGPEGVLMTFKPEQVKNLYFWYEKLSRGVKEQSGILRFFLYANPIDAEEGQTVTLDSSLRILADVSAITGEKPAG
jgi:uncharacterized protein DUF4838/glycosyl hydrolase family 67